MEFDSSSFFTLSDQGPLAISWFLFTHGGWVVICIMLIAAIYEAWISGRRRKFASKWQHVVLAIDIPRNNEQLPRAAENIFIALAAAQSNGNLLDTYWHGKVQESFSFEIVSLEGYIQFIIRAPSHFRDLVEASIYAQYPDAEITEVEDYAARFAQLRFPNREYNLWGTEFLLYKEYPFPIRTYPEFEVVLTGGFVDPMAAMLENLSRFGPGEQLWLQLVITPPTGWGSTAKKVVKEILGEKFVQPPTFVERLTAPIEWLWDWFAEIVHQLTGVEFGAGAAAEVKPATPAIAKLSPGERSMLERIQAKLSKHPFRVKFRLVYIGENAVFNKGRGVASVISAIQQFNTSNGNGFKPGSKTKTGADYFRVKQRVAERQNKILRHYVTRDNTAGESVDNMYLNSEELATIWHFPVLTVKAPQVEKIQSKKVAPPTRLPYEFRASAAEVLPDELGTPPPGSDEAVSTEITQNQRVGVPASESTERLATPPTNLPTV